MDHILERDVEELVFHNDIVELENMLKISQGKEKHFIQDIILFVSAYNDCFGVLSHFLNSFEEIDYENEAGDTPLTALLKVRHEDDDEKKQTRLQLAEKLIHSGADVNKAVLWEEKRENIVHLHFLSQFQDKLNEKSREIVKKNRILMLF